MQFLIAGAVHGDVNIDVRSDGALSSTDSVLYVVTIDNCTDVTSVSVNTGDATQKVSPADMEHVPGTATAYQYAYTMTGTGRYQPEVTVNFSDGSSQAHAETFHIEKSVPQLGFDAVRFASIDGQQHIIVSANAQDDVDITYVEFSVTGLRASDLRAAGGVVEQARKSAFAATQGARRVYPAADDQQTFELALPVSSELDAAAIAHDGLVLIDIDAVDASGNQSALSKISFTGDDVVETASDLQVRPASIIFTNLLETLTLIPSVDFQFRGRTPLPGLGTGVQYQSSNPDLIVVTPEGVVYPLAETGAENVTITVSYPGLPSVQVPVSVDVSKQLVSLRAEELNAQGQWVLERLNSWLPLPERIIAVFDDNSETEVGTQFPLEYLLASDAAGVLLLDQQNGLQARAIIPEQVPLGLIVRLKNQPAIQTVIPVVALDALPEIELNLPDQVKAGEQIDLEALVDDDVGIKEVRFFMGDTLAGTRNGKPYAISVQTTGQQAGQTFTFTATAVDSAGQQQQTAEKTVRIVAEITDSIPEAEFISPLAMQRCVEGTPIRFQMKNPASGSSGRSNIATVEFFIDGTSIGESVFPTIRKTGDGSGEEIWSLDHIVKQVSTHETTRACHAVLHMRSGASGESEPRLFRVVENQPPSVKILSPQEGASFSAGQTARIEIELADDTLNVGTEVFLLLNGARNNSYFYQDNAVAEMITVGLQRTTHVFTLPVTEEMVGTTLSLQLVTTDFHGLISKSEVLKVPVKADEPPAVAISYPGDGTHFVSGLPLEIRAAATDDVGIAGVDFYVDDRLVGSDPLAPYAFFYDTPADLTVEQKLKLHAVATDGKGQTGKSADVFVTLGKDEEPPVVNIVSPFITATEGGDSLAEVIEESEVVVKTAGYDNVLVDRLELRGVAKQGTLYVLTGNDQDILTGEDFAPQQVPGALRAFSALKLVKVPQFSYADGITHDRYPITVTATDATGNTSTAEIVVAVGPDLAPVVVKAQSDRQIYLPKDHVTIEVQAKDDRGVTALEVNYTIDGQARPDLFVRKGIIPDANGQLPPVDVDDLDLIPGPTVQTQFELDLDALGLSNGAHVIQAAFAATDNRGHRSDAGGPYLYEVHIQPDDNPPLAGISEPVQGSTLYHGDTIQVHWKAQDESRLSQISVTANGVPVHSQSLSEQTESGQFNTTVPASGDELVLALTAVDVFGNAGTTNWRYDLTSDEPPVISIRSPAPGSKLVEGEAFTLAATVSD
ncbi:MAG: Ig-like domain-containing protein, partial [Desulfobacteraceae bacterium]